MCQPMKGANPWNRRRQCAWSGSHSALRCIFAKRLLRSVCSVPHNGHLHAGQARQSWCALNVIGRGWIGNVSPCPCSSASVHVSPASAKGCQARRARLLSLPTYVMRQTPEVVSLINKKETGLASSYVTSCWEGNQQQCSVWSTPCSTVYNSFLLEDKAKKNAIRGCRTLLQILCAISTQPLTQHLFTVIPQWLIKQDKRAQR